MKDQIEILIEKLVRASVDTKLIKKAIVASCEGDSVNFGKLKRELLKATAAGEKYKVYREDNYARFTDAPGQIIALQNMLTGLIKATYLYETEDVEAGKKYLESVDSSLDEVKKNASIDLELMINEAEALLGEDKTFKLLEDSAKVESIGVGTPENALKVARINEFVIDPHGMPGKVNKKEVPDIYAALMNGLQTATAGKDLEKAAQDYFKVRQKKTDKNALEEMSNKLPMKAFWDWEDTGLITVTVKYDGWALIVDEDLFAEKLAQAKSKEAIVAPKSGYVVADFKTAKVAFLKESNPELVDSYIDTFKKIKDKNQIKDLEAKDIDKWAKKGWGDFKKFVDSFEGKKTKSEELKVTREQGVKLIAENEGWLVYKILTKDACIFYGANTKWCITETDKDHFINYSEKGDFYFYISKDKPKTDRWAKIAYLSEVNLYWDALDKPRDGASRLPPELKASVPKFKPDKFEPKIEIEGKKYTYEEFYAADGLKVGGNLDLTNTPIASLPENLKVGGNLDLAGTKITSLPENLKVGGDLYLVDTKITSLPDNLTVGGDLNLRNTPITSLPENLKVSGDLNLSNTKITSLPENLTVSGDLNLRNTPIASLPDNLTVGWNLNLENTPITSLPDNLTVGRGLYLNGTLIASLPESLKVKGTIRGFKGKAQGSFKDQIEAR